MYRVLRLLCVLAVCSNEMLMGMKAWLEELLQSKAAQHE
jgi:hypothetical protein